MPGFESFKRSTEPTMEERAAAREAAKKVMQEAEAKARVEAGAEKERVELKQRVGTYFREEERKRAVASLGEAIGKGATSEQIEAAKKAGQEREGQENVQL